MGTNTMALIQAFSVQAHHDCSTKGCLSLHSWQTAMLAHAGTCWHVRAHIGAWCHSTFSTCHSLGQQLQWFYKVLDIKFFHFKVARGLALGESWLLLAQMSIFALFRRKAFPSLYMVLASHDRRNNESNIGGFNGCSHVGSLNSAYWAFKHPSISIHLSNSFSCSMKFFHSKIALGLALGKSCPLFGKRW